MENKPSHSQYYPQLDAIRGIGIISIFFYHAYKPSFGASLIGQILKFCYDHLYLSIDLFFVLSSFLITLLALNEFEKNNSFSFKNYFVRRILRIWPLYFFIMFLGFVVVKSGAVYLNQKITLPPFGWYVFFVSNFYNEPHVFFLRQLWTISVEEQFYVLWGLTLLFFIRKIKWLILLYSLGSIFFVFWAAIKNIDVYFHFITYLNEMMAGAYLAYCIKNKNWLCKFVQSYTSIGRLFFYLFIPIFFVSYFFIDKNFTSISNNILYVVMRIIFILHCCLLVADQLLHTNNFFTLANKKFFVYSGKISYGLYCYHGFVITLVSMLVTKFEVKINPLLYVLAMLLITFITAHLSYKYLELPFLRMKSKLKIS